MAEPHLTNSPAVAPDNSEPLGNFNPELASKEEEPEEQIAIPPSTTPLPGLIGNQTDTEMTDVAPSPAIHPASATPTPAPNRTATPTRNVNGHVEAAPMPLKAAAHGAPARRYLNEKVTGVLLEGMKRLVIEQPEDPLRVLGEFLIQKSREIEGI